MSRAQKLKLNTSMSLLNRIVTIVSGLILPRLILLYFGSSTNGLVNSISRFLGVITFLDLGVGAVVKSALYQPIALKDNEKISSVLVAAKNYFQKIAYMLVIYVIVLIIFYPSFIDSNFNYFSTGFLIISMALNYFGKYYLGIVNELLLSANQQDYLQLGSEIIVVILNLIVSIVLITQGATIEIVKFGSGLVYLVRPLMLNHYVKKNFTVDYNIELEEDPLPQRWSGVGQHIAYSIQNGTDIVILTIFSTLENVSIYAVYNMVVSALKLLISSLTTSTQSFFGSLLANNEVNLMNNYFDKLEWGVHTGVIYLYGMAAVLIDPFVMLYTSGVDDVSYRAPLFSFLLVLAGATYSLRSPYQSIIFSAGHFQQTQVSSYIEACLNITVSTILVTQFGLIGVAVGTLVSMIYRTIYLVIYLSKNIIFRPFTKFFKHILVDLIAMGAIMGSGRIITNLYRIENLIDWMIVAFILGITSLLLLLIINMILYKKNMVSIIYIVVKRN